ncbi:Ig domain protein group 2 domain protein [Anaeromyxobacter dehalogenans 2CP-1]|uniref:Ig domain protein group 2 domain protein n=1 Tax=Anaeromyxobacter dehalogenans (strain ATCC BAA-258 / DSM 21875 / 2CP-1) TaxID=455488 RepID=B8JE29_ANAD2|nr:hypothetical protein [Anaeromyxobacter dehalogenans]ACL66094.1 Ig domain protein group 2 domain protein [Anaeromyxobacter dehalogenans 2CP-1]
MPITRLLLAFAVLAALAGCGGGGSTSTQGPLPPAGQTVTVEVRPKEIQVAPGGTVDFSSVVTGTADTGVTWEADAGTVSQTGSYVAPLAAGTYTVSATSKGNGLAKGRSKVVVTPTPAPISVTVSPSTAAVGAGGTVAFTATVSNAIDPSVAWTVREPSGCGSVSAAGVYTAPGAAATCHVVAASVADPTATAEATVTVSAPTLPGPVVVSLSPVSGAVDACRTLTFTATVTGAANGAVTWSVQEGAAGGSITSGGVYTAPDAAGTYHVVATSQASGTASKVAAVTVSDRILGVSVSPATVELAPGASAQFTATVTTTCGAYATTRTITAPN